MESATVVRTLELGLFHSFLDGSSRELAAVLLEGEAGIGKSTLWLAGAEIARGRRLRVLTSRPADAEQGLAHVGLGDLFESVLDDVLPAVSPPRRRALEVALVVEESNEVADPRTLGVAVRSGLEMLAAEAPVLVAIDTGCVSSPTAGAMGYHYFNEELMADNAVDALEPEVLVYASAPDGGLKLVAVEWVVRGPQSNPPRVTEPPSVLGMDMHIPIPFPGPDFYIKHAWIWMQNPSGMFADWSPEVTCP